MIILSAKEIKKAFGIDSIIKNATFAIRENDKVGLVGINGAGKSTLFKIIRGDLEKDEGELFIAKNNSIGYMSQLPNFNSSASLWNEVLKVFTPIINMEKKLRELEHKISKLSHSSNKSLLESLMKSYSNLQHSFEMADGFSYESRTRGVLKGLGFSEDEYSKNVSTFSGGQKTRIAFAKVLLKKHDILLLDEPTNYLDIAAVEWLEEFLKNYKGVLMIISHDRYLLDNITNRTLEIENGILKEYEGNYSKYIVEKEREKVLEYKEYENKQKEVERQKAIIARFRQYNREKSIRQANSREKMLQRMGELARPIKTLKNIRFDFEPKKRSGNDVLSLKNISKSYNHILFKNLSLDIYRGEKVALLGPNGIGKSTLLKIIAGEVQADTGSIKLGVSVIPSYYDQEQDNLDQEKIIIDEIWDTYPKLSQVSIRNALATFLFEGEDVFKKISVLSGGEKSRLSLLKIMLSKANFLLLDEPTNHLDMKSREVLEKALQNYNGTVLFISHDRYFLNKVSTSVAELKENGIVVYKGDYSYYVKNRQLSYGKESLCENAEKINVSTSKSQWLRRKEERAIERQRQKRLVDIEKEILLIEDRLSDINTELESPAVFSDHIKCQALNLESINLKSQINNLYEEWGILSESET